MSSLLEKTRKINRLLQRSENVEYDGISRVLSNVLNANVYITNKKDKTPDTNKQLKRRKIPFNHTTIGPITMVTDGTDWYIHQTKGALW